MGNQKSLELNEEWEELEILSPRKTTLFRNKHSLQELERFICNIDQAQLDIFLESIRVRQERPPPNSVRIFKYFRSSNKNICASGVPVVIFTERIRQSLSEMWRQPVQNSIKTLKQSLVGFEGLHNIQPQGFEITDEMIGLNNAGQVRVWFNQNFAEHLSTTRQMHSTNSYFISEQSMVKTIIQIIQTHTINNKLPVLFKQRLFKRVGSPLKFSRVIPVLEDQLKPYDVRPTEPAIQKQLQSIFQVQRKPVYSNSVPYQQAKPQLKSVPVLPVEDLQIPMVFSFNKVRTVQNPVQIKPPIEYSSTLTFARPFTQFMPNQTKQIKNFSLQPAKPTQTKPLMQERVQSKSAYQSKPVSFVAAPIIIQRHNKPSQNKPVFKDVLEYRPPVNIQQPFKPNISQGNFKVIANPPRQFVPVVNMHPAQPIQFKINKQYQPEPVKEVPPLLYKAPIKQYAPIKQEISFQRNFPSFSIKPLNQSAGFRETPPIITKSINMEPAQIDINKGLQKVTPYIQSLNRPPQAIENTGLPPYPYAHEHKLQDQQKKPSEFRMISIKNLTSSTQTSNFRRIQEFSKAPTSSFQTVREVVPYPFSINSNFSFSGRDPNLYSATAISPSYHNQSQMAKTISQQNLDLLNQQNFEKVQLTKSISQHSGLIKRTEYQFQDNPMTKSIYQIPQMLHSQQFSLPTTEQSVEVLASLKVQSNSPDKSEYCMKRTSQPSSQQIKQIQIKPYSSKAISDSKSKEVLQDQQQMHLNKFQNLQQDLQNNLPIMEENYNLEQSPIRCHRFRSDVPSNVTQNGKSQLVLDQELELPQSKQQSLILMEAGQVLNIEDNSGGQSKEAFASISSPLRNEMSMSRCQAKQFEIQGSSLRKQMQVYADQNPSYDQQCNQQAQVIYRQHFIMRDEPQADQTRNDEQSYRQMDSHSQAAQRTLRRTVQGQQAVLDSFTQSGIHLNQSIAQNQNNPCQTNQPIQNSSAEIFQQYMQIEGQNDPQSINEAAQHQVAIQQEGQQEQPAQDCEENQRSILSSSQDLYS